MEAVVVEAMPASLSIAAVNVAWAAMAEVALVGPHGRKSAYRGRGTAE